MASGMNMCAVDGHGQSLSLKLCQPHKGEGEPDTNETALWSALQYLGTSVPLLPLPWASSSPNKYYICCEFMKQLHIYVKCIPASTAAIFPDLLNSGKCMQGC